MLLSTIRSFHIDAFTSKLFSGNPAAVCVLEQWLPAQLLQAVAAEFNLSETAFIVAEGDSYSIRWFAPNEEVELCGHATLAAAFVIHHYVEPGVRHIKFSSPKYQLEVTVKNGGFELSLPKFSYQPLDISKLDKPLQRIEPAAAYQGNGTLVLQLADEAAVLGVVPPLNHLVQNKIFLAVTAAAQSERYDFVSRFFLPAIGIDEDPVTGSLHCLLGPIWSDRLGRLKLRAFQASKRGGEIELQILEDRVLLFGKAQLFMTGTMTLP